MPVKTKPQGFPEPLLPLSPLKPLSLSSRIIIHIDFNSYFASVEQQANPLLRGKPIAITGKNSERLDRSVVTTASLEAKARGVKTAMSTWEAKRICPDLILVAGDPYKYSDITHRFNEVFKEFASRIEQFSVDESFLDVTEEAQDYLGATYLAQMIRERIREVCGEHITASIGIAPNRLMAKLSSEQVKPNGITVTRPEDTIALLDASALDDICGIGPRIKHRLNLLGIETFAQLRAFPLLDLIEEFKSYGTWLHEAAHGRDHSEVTFSQKGIRGFAGEDPKSVGHSYTLPHDTDDPKEMKRYLLGLADKVAWRLRRDGFVAHQLSVYVRYADFGGTGKQKRFAEATNNGLTLFQVAWRLLNTIRDPYQSVRLVGISASGLTRGPEQQPLFKKEQKVRSVLSSLDRLQHRYGSGVWTRASLLETTFKARSSGFHFDHEM